MEDIFADRIAGYQKVTGKETDVSKAYDNSPEKIKKASTRRLDSDELEDYTSKDIDINSLEVIGTLGKGSFGHVQLVKVVF